MKNTADLSTATFTPVNIRNRSNAGYRLHYKELPLAKAYGKTEREAELNLIDILMALLNTKKDDIREKSINDYYAD